MPWSAIVVTSLVLGGVSAVLVEESAMAHAGHCRVSTCEAPDRTADKGGRHSNRSSWGSQFRVDPHGAADDVREHYQDRGDELRDRFLVR